MGAETYEGVRKLQIGMEMYRRREVQVWRSTGVEKYRRGEVQAVMLNSTAVRRWIVSVDSFE